MSSIGTGYDLSSSTYSPDGRIFQVEYANKAVENSGTAIGLRVNDGIVLAVERLVTSKLLIKNSNRRIASADYHVGVAAAGFLADARSIVNRTREECLGWRDNYRQTIPGHTLAQRMSLFFQTYTLYSSVRPFGASVLLASMDEAYGPQLHLIEPSGLCQGFFACAIGKGRTLAKTEMEKLDLPNLTVKQAVKEAAKIIHTIHDEVKDKKYELDLSWISKDTGYKHQIVPDDVLAEALEYAKQSMEIADD